MSPHRSLLIAPLITLIIASAACAADEPLRVATESVTATELRDHVVTLADDVFEGRGVGTRGGRAAGQYIIQQLRETRLQPAGREDGYFQPCDRGGRNILVFLSGADPVLKHETIVVGAHYDHVGDGRQGNVRGTLGSIHNGADDNASGVAALLETIEAISKSGIRPRRSILFAFWDGEEMNLVGSKQWFKTPTIPLSTIRLAFNIDMVGRLRNGRLEVLGTRSGYGMRRFLCGDIDEKLSLEFPWELTANSDHWPFLEHRIPVVMLHTGLHDDYHKPSDDAEKINHAGLEAVTRYLLNKVVEAANADRLPVYRPARYIESLATHSHQRQRNLSFGEPSRPRPRLGIAWRTDEAEPGSVFITYVAKDSPAAAAGLVSDDRLDTINGSPFADTREFRSRVFQLLDAGTTELTFSVESRGHVRTVTVRLPTQSIAANTGT